mmetsp:Transcript_18533/g.25694  ORF Transcript_18533/g.25694 Transcript_18533/m.25694 type:complete len:145 (-) Transcript_18533:456-890(-)
MDGATTKDQVSPKSKRDAVENDGSLSMTKANSPSCTSRPQVTEVPNAASVGRDYATIAKLMSQLDGQLSSFVGHLKPLVETTPETDALSALWESESKSIGGIKREIYSTTVATTSSTAAMNPHSSAEEDTGEDTDKPHEPLIFL